MNDHETAFHEYPFDPRRLILRWLISTLAIFSAVWVVPGIKFEGPGWQLGIVAIVLGLLKALGRPLLLLLTLPLVIITLGLFSLVINALLLGLTSAMASNIGIQFEVVDFWAAFWGSIVISLVSLLLSMLAGDQRIQVHVQRGGQSERD
jgi:putative membrane protein